ncbi:MAG: FKBP-type peptidyl-prolyl cis-trans isomerase [Muribaculaceae bacterium]|nr:FKBP-type peptidyl-prolyl cis-trans isomerase [Muribaculaceae bacterium]
MKLKTLFVSLLLSVVSFSSMAQDKGVESGTDSLNIALGVLWNEQFAEMHQNDSLKADSLFSGMREGVRLVNSTSIYDAGVFQGVLMMMRANEMLRDGIFIKPDQIISTLSDLAHGKSVGMDKAGAEKYIHDFFSPQNNTPDSVSVESQEAFLNEQLKRPGVTKTESGLLFEVIKEGYGASPVSGNKVIVKYTGRLADGTVFDQTGDKSVTFPIDNLVPGFTEGLKMMKAGGKYRLFIPARLGYGSQNVQGVIPGNSALDFTVELINVIIE